MMFEGPRPLRQSKLPAATRLHSWKEIAGWFNRTERTVQRWERQDALPVHRLHHGKRGSIYADTAELEAWASGRRDLLAEPQPAHRWIGPAAGVTVLLAALGWIIFTVGGNWFASSRLMTPSVALRTVRLTALPGTARMPVFSPDGSRVAFSWDPEGASRPGLFVMLPGSPGEPRPLLPQRRAEVWPAWSPDGRWITFFRPGSNGAPSEVAKVPAIGGAEAPVTKVCPYGRTLPYPYQAWAPDSRRLILADRSGSSCEGAPFALHLLDLASGERIPLTRPEAGLGDSAPSLSPGGRWLAYVNTTPGRYRLMLAEFSSTPGKRGPAIVLDQRREPIAAPVWSPNGRDLFYVTFVDAQHRLWRLRIPGGTPQPVSVEGRLGGSVSLSPKGDRLLFNVAETDYDLWRFDLHGSGKPRKFASSTARDLQPIVSPAGDRLLFVSNRSGRGQIWLANIDDSGHRAVTEFLEGTPDEPAWSPDGESLAFSLETDRGRQLLVASVQGASLRRIETAGEARGAAWSPDGKWIYFHTSRGGEFGVYRVPASGGQVEAVNLDRASLPRFAPTGGALICLHGGSASVLWQHREGQSERLCPVPRDLNAFSVTALGIYFEGPGQQLRESILYRYRFSSRRVERVASLPQGIEGGFTVTPDDRTLFFASFERRGSDLWMIENFM